MTDFDVEAPAGDTTDGRSRSLGGAFNRIWLALTVSLIGNEVTSLAIPLIAAVTLDASPFEVGIVGAATSLPFLLFSLPAGVLVDMLPRRRVMVTTDVLSALVLVALPVAWAFDAISIPMLCAVGFVLSSCAVCFEVAHYALIPSIVPGHRIVDANSRLQMSYSAADWAGPGVAGALIQVITAPFAVIVDSLSFAASALLLGSLKGAEPERDKAEKRPTIRQALVDGLQFLLHEGTLRPLILLAGLGMVFNTALAAVTVLYFVRELGLQPIAIGALFAVASLGAIPGAALARWAGEHLGVGRTILCGWSLSAASGLAIPLVDGPTGMVIGVLGLAYAAGAVVFTAANVQQWTLRQLLAPERLGGRVTAGYRFAVQGMGVLGAAGGGYVAGVIGLRPAMLIYATGGVLVPLLGFLTRLRSLRIMPPSVNEPLEEAAAP